MKIIIGFHLFLTSQISFAGDLVVICENENRSIMKELDSTGADLEIPINENETVHLLVQPLAKTSSTYRFVVKNSEREVELSAVLGVFEEFRISDYTCAVRD